MPGYDLVVIGAGAVGCSAAYHAAGEGRSVLLLEQFTVGHDRGSSHGESRIIRHSYTSAAYASLAPSAFELWRALERETGADLLTMTGGIDIGRATNPAMIACREALAEAEIGTIWLEGADAATAFPQFVLREGDAILWQSGAGILNAGRCVRALAGGALSRGATVVEHARVASIEPRASGATVQYVVDGRRTSVETGAVVVAAGPWAKGFFEELGIPNNLGVTHQQVIYYPVEDPALWATGRCPIYISHGRDGFYGFPICERPGFIKIAVELDAIVDNPDELPREPDPQAVERLNELVATSLYRVRPMPAEVVTCRYTETADRDFIVDRHPDHPHIAVASPCSGHGFKFSMVTGRLVAQLATSDATPDSFADWRPQFALTKSEAVAKPLASEWRD